MDPATIISSLPDLVKAYESINSKLKEAQSLSNEDAKYYVAQIEIATTAIRALQDECIGILLQATVTPPGENEKAQALLSRMRHYFHSEVLRPRLTAAIGELRVGHQMLQEHADKLFLFPTVKLKRNQAINDYGDMLRQLDGFLAQLGNWSGPSGCALSELESLFEAYTKSDPAAQELAEDLLLRIQKGNFFRLTDDCARAVGMLRIAFR